MRKQSKSERMLVTLKEFANEYGIDLTASRRYIAILDDGTLAIDTKSPIQVLPNPPRRTKKK
ncbi:MAG: hypothetical protein V4671_22615 [Armatimonadota bacterium]